MIINPRPVDIRNHKIWLRPLLALNMHHNDVIMSTMAYQITSLTMVYSTVYSGVDQREHQSSASLSFGWGIHRWPVNSPHKGPVTRKCSHLMTSSLFDIVSRLSYISNRKCISFEDIHSLHFPIWWYLIYHGSTISIKPAFLFADGHATSVVDRHVRLVDTLQQVSIYCPLYTQSSSGKKTLFISKQRSNLWV